MTSLQEKIREYREFKRMAEEAQALADAIADELKAAMTEAGETELTVGDTSSPTPKPSGKHSTRSVCKKI